MARQLSSNIDKALTATVEGLLIKTTFSPLFRGRRVLHAPLQASCQYFDMPYAVVTTAIVQNGLLWVSEMGSF